MMTLNDIGLSFSDAEANIGVRDLGLRLTVEGETNEVRYGKPETDGSGSVAEGKVGEHLTVRTTVTAVPGLQAVVLQHVIKNSAERPVFLNEISTGQFAETAAVLHGTGSWLGWDLSFCHTDNVRTEHFPHCQMEFPYVRMLPTEKVSLGRGEDQAFPAVWINDTHGKAGIVFAAASQALNYTVFELRKGAMVNTSIFEEFAIHHDSGQSGGLEVPTKGELVLDGIFIQLLGDTAPEDVFVDFIDYLAERFTFREPKTALLTQAFHCTWNYGVYADQTEALLLPTARFISKNIPNIKWFLMDVGYFSGDTETCFLDAFYPDPKGNVCAEKWPRGIKGYTDEMRSLGLRPGLWWSPTVHIPSQLHDDHPDWFLRNADGSFYLIGQHAFLDYSNDEALDYLDRTLAVILGEWGMDACKMDFWTGEIEAFDGEFVSKRLGHVPPCYLTSRFPKCFPALS